MKKRYLCFILVALLFSACQANSLKEPATSQATGNPTTTITYQNESSVEATTVNRSSSNVNQTTAIIWVENGATQGLDEDGFRTVGIINVKVDLSQPDGFWVRESWDAYGHKVDPWSDLSQILGQKIMNRDEAAHVANRILASEQSAGRFADLKLGRVMHDPDKNIWFFSFINKNIMLNLANLAWKLLYLW